MKNDAIFIIVVLFRGTFRASRHDTFFGPSSLHSSSKTRKNEKKKRIEREREKRDANVFSLLSPRKRENTIPYSHETMPYFSLLYIYMYEVCVCVAC